MTAPAAAALGRRLAERQMTSTCTVFTPGAKVTDPATGAVTRAELDPHTSRCRIRPAGATAATAEAGGAEVNTAALVVSLPVGHVPVPAVHQWLRIDTCPDPGLVGVRLVVEHVAAGDHLTARRLTCSRTV